MGGNNRSKIDIDTEYSIDETEERYEDTDETEDDEDTLEYQRHEGTGENVNEKPTIDNFFNTEQLLQEVEKTMRGYQKKNGEWVYVGKPKARGGFINSMMNSLRSVINQQNMISYMDLDTAKFLLLEKNKDFIHLTLDEPSVSDEDFETIINIFDHALQIFMGQVVDGHGARTLKQVSAAVSYEVENRKRDDSIFSFGWGDQNVLKIGGKNK